MIAVAIWIALSPFVGAVVGRLIGAVAVDQVAANRCTHACNQGRNCTCR